MNKADIGIVEKLEPCPFCREPDAFAERADFSSSYVVCNNCLARGPTCCQDGDAEDEPGKDAAIVQWNTRTPDPIIMEMVEALERVRGTLAGNKLALTHIDAVNLLDTLITKVSGK